MKSNGIIYEIVRKAEVKDTNSIVKSLEHRFFLEVKETRVWESVAILLDVHEELEAKLTRQ